MKYRKLTDTGDYSFGNGSRDFISGDAALAQAIKTRILLFYNEWWEDLTSGIPMFQSILGQVDDKNVSLALQSLLTKRIKEFPQVRNVRYENVVIDRRTRGLSLSAICELYSGEEVEVKVIS